MDKTEDAARNLAIINLAREYESEGDLELDDDELVVISEGDDNGAYVKMWKWIDFAGTPLDKEKDEDGEAQPNRSPS